MSTARVESYSPATKASSQSTIPIQVIRREVLSRDVVSLFFAKPGTNLAPTTYLPGQFVTLVLPGQAEEIYRSYSLCGRGDPREPWEITVKRVKTGMVSNYLFDTVQVGMVLQSTAPRGSFVLPQQLRRDMHIIFVAAGSGITPIRGMLRALATVPATSRPQVQLHYASRTSDDIIYRAELAQMDPQQQWLKQWHYLSSQGSPMTPQAIMANAGPVTPTTHWYMCGPETLRRDLSDDLVRRRVPTALIHAEVFGDQSTRRHIAGGPTVARIAIQDTGATITARAQETLLEALERQGYRPDFSCRTGTCGTCKLHVLGGRVTMPATTALPKQERAAGYVLSCVARPQGDITIQSGGRPPIRGTMWAAGAASMQRAASQQKLRVVTVALLGLTLAGIWGMTGHKPANVQVSLPSISLPSFDPGNTDPGNTDPGTNPPAPTVTTRSS